MVERENVEVPVPLKYFSNFQRTLEMFLTNCKINLIFTWPSTCVISEGNRATTFAIQIQKFILQL